MIDADKLANTPLRKRGKPLGFTLSSAEWEELLEEQAEKLAEGLASGVIVWLVEWLVGGRSNWSWS